ncbi:type VI secretion system baseplate subunit TssK [Chitiniphilus purpureus]|uniref:Type VI secretion system baseplate subunit TssK n=1 Tax=Chitiniphilus purpureus TaxID=2981137 RepID=A0ABY6DJQ1_9NEIS|nr:type VI secretion system baseplate subunit TssK [Chitiniphilus sp. CD1]UXY14574.1 type VI secretion system baseplate subunit TssK [Chitiniphilus sp. CD1]
MLKAKRVLWGEGMFLRPQHFQQQALLNDNAVAEALLAVQRHAWGLRSFELDHAALRNGLIRADQLSVTFRDGTQFAAPQREPLPLSRDLNEIPQLGVDTMLYACLPNLNPYGGNTANADTPPGRPSRFRNAHYALSDLYTQSLEADLTTLELDLRLMVEEENRDGYDSVPIARLTKDATGQWRAADDYLPPMTTVSANPALPRMIRRLLDILLVKSESLAGAHRERAKNVMEYGTTDIASFWLLHTVNRNFARLNHLLHAEPLHPEELYVALAEFCGELLTFSSIYTLADLPAYRHEQLGDTLPKLDEQIRELLDTVISARYAVIPLTSPKPSFYIGRLESDRLLENVDFYLSVQSDLPAAQVIEAVPFKFKVGAPDDVEKILNSALRGVSLAHAPQTPSAIPVRVGNHYFALEPRGDIFQRMLQSRSVCIYVPQTLVSLKIELIAVFR